MNEVHLRGWFASEAALEADSEGVTHASFIMRVSEGDQEAGFFRVICRDAPARKIGDEAAKNELLGRLVVISGSLRQSTFSESGADLKLVYVDGTTVEFPLSPFPRS